MLPFVKLLTPLVFFELVNMLPSDFPSLIAVRLSDSLEQCAATPVRVDDPMDCQNSIALALQGTHYNPAPVLNKDQLSLTNPRDTLHHGKHATDE